MTWYTSTVPLSFTNLYHLKLLLLSTSSSQSHKFINLTFTFHWCTDPPSLYFFLNSKYSSLHPIFPSILNLSATTFTNLPSSNFANLSCRTSSILFLNFLHPKSTSTATPATVLLAPNHSHLYWLLTFCSLSSCKPNFSKCTNSSTILPPPYY